MGVEVAYYKLKFLGLECAFLIGTPIILMIVIKVIIATILIILW